MMQIGGTMRLLVNVPIQEQIDVAMQFCKLAYSAICGVEQSILYRIFMGIWMKTATSTIFIEIVLVIRENSANFASVLVL